MPPKRRRRAEDVFIAGGGNIIKTLSLHKRAAAQLELKRPGHKRIHYKAEGENAAAMSIKCKENEK